MEWEQFVDLCDRARVEQLATVTSDIDFGNDNGMPVARITAAVDLDLIQAHLLPGISGGLTDEMVQNRLMDQPPAAADDQTDN